MQSIDGLIVLSPTDLVGFTGCEHRSRLDREVALGRLAPVRRQDELLDLLRHQGAVHEQHHLEALISAGASVVTIDRPAATLVGLRDAEARTVAAMREGVDVIYQASFFDGRWRGHADFLRRVEVPSALGAWSYEAYDTKLARSTTAGALLQLGDYSRQLERLQEVAPRRLHVVLGDGTVESFLFAEIAAYLAAVRERFVAAVDGGLTDTVADPVAACRYCDWKDRCTSQWRADDHLSFVAGIRRDQRVRLVAAGVGTRAALATLPEAAEVEQVRPAVLAALREQAQLQVRSDGEAVPRWQLIDPDPDAPHRGLASLPAPSPADIFFDMEGDLFAAPGGREYLFGWVEGDSPNTAFQTLWAHDPDAERAAFEGFIDTVMAARRRDPGMHVYHYATYEQTAVKRLMGRYGTREEEVDELLRGGAFIDLHRVVMQSVRVGVESYSIKKLEPLYQGRRSGAITDAGASIVEYERWLAAGDARILESIASYNEDDCRSLVGLRRWLEDRRRELEAVAGGTLPRPKAGDGAASEAVAAGTEAVERLAAELTAGVPADPRAQTTDEHGRSLLAALLDWHRRDAKPAWWEYFARQDASSDDLIDDASAIAGLEFEGVAGQEKKSQLFRFTFPPQECKLAAGSEVEDARTADDGAGGKLSRALGAIHDIDTAAGWLVLRRQQRPDPLPAALIAAGPPSGTVHRDALIRLGEWDRDHGIDAPGPFRAVRDLLVRRAPRISGLAAGTPLRRPGEEAVAAARRSIAGADQTCIAVQGPPGSGKTYTGAMAIVDAVTASPPRRVAVTALSHRAISHLLGAACAEARRRGVSLRVMQRSNGACCPDGFVTVARDTKSVEAAVAAGDVDVVAGTSWLLARSGLAGRFDVLVVDEAGQLSLANVAAMGGCARTIVLLGDPQQLEQPSAAAHPPGAEASALGHLLGAAETVADDRGIFLDLSWRMHPDVCSYVSDNFYESRLRSIPDCARQRVAGADALGGTGLRWVPVAHPGDRTSSAAEAVAVARVVAALVGRRWVDRHGLEQQLTVADVLVVAPYNAHVAALRRALPDGVAVGTVDRFQGQEAAVVVYSMATSLAEDVPRGMEFLYSRNRMNVAISRARCLAVLVCSPELIRVSCSTAAQILLANALCSFAERATIADAGALPGALSAIS